MARIDADGRDCVSLAALRDGNGDRKDQPGAGPLACELIGSPAMLASEK
jgi:hypothetical protein